MLLQNRRAELPGRWHSFTRRARLSTRGDSTPAQGGGLAKAIPPKTSPFRNSLPCAVQWETAWGPHRAGCPPELACADLRTPNRFQTNPVGFLVVCNSIKLTNWSLCPESFHRLYFSICQSGRPSDSRWLPAHSTDPMPTHHWGSVRVCVHACTQAQRGRHKCAHTHMHTGPEKETQLCLHACTQAQRGRHKAIVRRDRKRGGQNKEIGGNR